MYSSSTNQMVDGTSQQMRVAVAVAVTMGSAAVKGSSKKNARCSQHQHGEREPEQYYDRLLEGPDGSCKRCMKGITFKKGHSKRCQYSVAFKKRKKADLKAESSKAVTTVSSTIIASAASNSTSDSYSYQLSQSSSAKKDTKVASTDETALTTPTAATAATTTTTNAHAPFIVNQNDNISYDVTFHTRKLGLDLLIENNSLIKNDKANNQYVNYRNIYVSGKHNQKSYRTNTDNNNSDNNGYNNHITAKNQTGTDKSSLISIGDSMISVGGIDVTNKSVSETKRLISESSRPITITFLTSPKQPRLSTTTNYDGNGAKGKNLNKKPSSACPITTTTSTSKSTTTKLTGVIRTRVAIDAAYNDKKKAADIDVLLVMSHDTLSAKAIRDEVNRRMNMEKSKGMKRSNNIPMEVCVLVEYLLSMLPERYFPGTNKMMGGDDDSTDEYQKLIAYRKHFPPGTVGFTVPPSDKSKRPDPHYHVLEGRKIYIVRWELNFDQGGENNLKCFRCNNGDLISQQYDYYCNGYLTSIIDLHGTTSFAASMTYKCNNVCCGCICKATDGRMYHQLPYQIRNGYPVDSKYAIEKQVHISLPTTRVMEKLMITNVNKGSEQFTRIIHELRSARYTDLVEDFYTQAKHTNLVVDEGKVLINEQIWCGLDAPTASQIIDLYNEGLKSELNSSSMSMSFSERMRHTSGNNNINNNSSSLTANVIQKKRKTKAAASVIDILPAPPQMPTLPFPPASTSFSPSPFASMPNTMPMPYINTMSMPYINTMSSIPTINTIPMPYPTLMPYLHYSMMPCTTSVPYTIIVPQNVSRKMYCCKSYKNYMEKRIRGVCPRGRPPHTSGCIQNTVR